jgi:multidrug efflux pump subunit AcrA (membrane-fusion protein)
VGETVSRGQGAGQEAAGGHAEDLAAVEAGGTSRRRWGGWAATGLLVVLAAGVVLSAWRDGVFSPVASSGSGGQGTPAPATAAVTRQDMAATTPVNATLGYAGSYPVTGRSGGTLTWLPPAGQVIRQGQVLYRIDNGTPVVLLYGPVPFWRALHELMTGQDVSQLNHDLVALGDADSADISFLGWDYFSWETKAGVEKLQSALGVSSPSGSLPLGQVVFEPEAIRVSQVTGSLGGPANGPVLAATSDRHVVTIQLSTSQASGLAVGNAVTVTLPDGASTPGTISSVGTVASGTASNATIPVTVRLVHSSAAGLLDQAPVTVTITTFTAHDVLAVPVTALLAQASGRYAVEVVGPRNTRRWVPVTTGIFDDAGGRVQVTGSLTPGQRVVVAAS